jgi:hypothetical protein
MKINQKAHLAHRLVFLYHRGYLPEFIDHIDQNKLNNKIENLREITNSENQHNKGLNRNNSSGYKGVSWKRNHKKWRAGVQVNKKEIHLGYYDTPEEAYKAYCNYVQNNLTIYCLGDNNGSV